MADDAEDDEFETGSDDDDVDPDDELDDEDLEDDDDLALPEGDEVADDDEDEEEAEEATPAPAKTRRRRGTEEAEGDEDEDEALDPDDVEEDLDTILKDRLAADDEYEDDDDEDTPDAAKPATVGEDGSKLPGRRADEFVCQQCFLLVSGRQLGPKGDRRCPNGEDPCWAIDHVNA